MTQYRHPSGRTLYIEDLLPTNHVRLGAHGRLNLPPLGISSSPGLTSMAPIACNSKPGEFSICNIPNVMRWQLGWPVAARVMEKWFELPAHGMHVDDKGGRTKPNAVQCHVDTELIRWSWLNQFSRVGKAEQELLSTLQTPLAKKRLEDMLRERLSADPRLRSTASNGTALVRNRDVIDAHSFWQFQLSQVGYGRPSDMDDLYGALGRFAVYAAVNIGQIQSLGSNRYTLSVSEIAVYARDTYDFIDAQYLGHWSFKGLAFNLAGLVKDPAIDAVRWLTGDRVFDNSTDREWRYWGFSLRYRGFMQPINNSDFRHYQSTHGRGGDYLLFSDIKRVPVNLSVEVSL